MLHSLVLQLDIILQLVDKALDGGKTDVEKVECSRDGNVPARMFGFVIAGCGCCTPSYARPGVVVVLMLVRWPCCIFTFSWQIFC